MTELLLRMFVKEYPDLSSGSSRSTVGKLSGYVGIGCNVLLFVLKLLTGWLSGSVSITADALNNLSDASGSVLTLVGFRLADKPADEHHPYGHARAEYLSGLAVAVLILFIGAELGKTALQKILHPEPVVFTAAAAFVLAASIGVKLWMYRFNRRLGNRIGSKTLLATAADSRNDCVATAAVLAAAWLESRLQIPLDGFFAMGVAVFIVKSGWDLAKETISPLLGESADPQLRKTIAEFVCSQSKVLGYHDLMVHDYGPGNRFATLHVEMDHREDPLDCHDLIDMLERQCLHQFGVHLVIHLDPVVTDDPELLRLKEESARMLQEYDGRLTLHDFRMVPGRKHMNLVFDVALPSDLRGKEDRIRQAIEDTLNAEGPLQYHVKITYDSAEFNP